MAVAPTGAIYKALEFDGVSSRTYGVYITGEAVYNAPERDVEMVTIPGRNGTYALDNGRFENIEVTYPAGIFAETEADFRQAISEFRNFLCSRKGYVRLQDEYNPDEYRLAAYKSGLEVEPAMLKAGKFKIIFDCKPQRFLTSGETAVSVESGDTLTNPTLFEASPMLEIEGYGTLNVNGTEIEIADELVGDVYLSSAVGSSLPFLVTFPEKYVAQEDDIEIDGAYVSLAFKHMDSSYSARVGDSYINSWSGYASSAPVIQSAGSSLRIKVAFTSPWPIQYNVFEARTVDCSAMLCFRKNSVDSFYRVDITAKLRYGDKGPNIVGLDYSVGYKAADLVLSLAGGGIDGGIIHSTATTFGHPTYIDCDLGEAYADDNGVISSLNQYISLGSELPKLSVGESEITYDETIDEVKVSPRWWRV